MNLTVISGLPGAGAHQRARSLLAESAGAGSPALMLVPSSGYARRLRTELAPTCPVGVEVVSVSRLIDSEWRLKGDGRRIVSGPYREVVLSRALVAAGVSRQPGPGAVCLLGTLATSAFSAGADLTVRGSGIAGSLLDALRCYRAALEGAGLVDAAEAARALAGCSPPAHTIVVEGLVPPTPDVETLLLCWAGAGSSVAVCLPWRPGCAATAPLDAFVRRLEEAGATVEDADGPSDGRPPELARVASSIFSADGPALSDGKVELGLARGEEAEARLVAERVVELRAANTAPGDIAVVFGDPGSHAGWLRRAFDDAGIDAVWDIRVPVTETPLGRSMLRLWTFCAKGMAREDLAAFMRSPFSGVAAARADSADAAWRESRAEGAELMRRADRARPLVKRCSRLAGLPVGPETVAEWKRLADDLLSGAYGGDAPVPGMDGALDAATHRAFCEALTAAADNEPIASAELFRCFEAAAVSPASQEAPGRVTVTSVRKLNGRSFAAVIIGGMTSGETLRSGSDDLLEGEAAAAALRSLGAAHDPDENARAQRLAFYLAVTAATRSLTLVRQESDDEGRALRASVFWDQFLDLYGEPGREDGEREGLLPVRRRLADDASESRGHGRAPRGSLDDPASIAALEEIDAVSPGSVERYLECPYRWFVETRLRPRSLDTEVDNLIAGQLAHRALAAFYREWAAGGHARVTGSLVDEALEMARTALAKAVSESPEPSSLDEEWLLAKVEAGVLGLVARDAHFLPDYVPAALEWSFGYGEGEEPVDVGGVRIKGRADRIDTGPEGLVVIDYKLSRADSLTSEKASGLVQLQLYALAASTRLGLPVAGGLYRSLKEPLDRGFILDAVNGSFKSADILDTRGIAALLGGAVDLARGALDGMRAGAIAPAPDTGRCGFCAALGFCPEARHA